MIKRIYIVCLLITVGVFADWFVQGWDNPVGTGFQLLEVEEAVRVQGMAGAGVALQDSNTSASEINPALEWPKVQIRLGQNYPFGPFSAAIQKASWVFPIVGTHWGSVRLSRLGYDDLDGYSNNYGESVSTGKYSAQTMQAAMAGGGMAYGWRWGTQLGVLLDQIEVQQYLSVVSGFGIQKNLWSEVSIGASTQNLGIYSSASHSDPDIRAKAQLAPFIARAGLGWEHNWKDWLKLAAFTDVRVLNNEYIYIPVGTEWTFAKILHIRTGYRFGDETQVSMGAGVNWKQFVFDYAITVQEEIGNAQSWSLGIGF